ncbi:MAG TPA: SDR family NAD(P)-dependent oxidoreductase [Polyangium sp.]|nr:SDR family NAD(P)-dependent oxidoreductase [Polyangium sp.]
MHVAITGASVGIGEAMARAWAAKGASLTLIARRKDKLDALAKELGPNVYVHELDLSDSDRATEWIVPAEKALGPIDVIINNAGVQHVEKTELAKPEEGEKLLRLNVFSPLRIVHALLPGMITRKSGTIVDVASMCAITPMPGMYYYNASKGALACASEGLRGELRGTGVHIVTVYPGPVATDMGTSGLAKYESTWASRLSPMGNSEALAKLVVRAVEKKKARVVYPRSLESAMLFPRLARWVTAMFTPPLKR